MFIRLIVLFILTRFTQEDCSVDWIQMETMCYKYFETDTDFAAAASSCSSVNADLVMPKSFSELNHVAQYQDDYMWIGMNGDVHSTSVDDFVWLDGTSIDYTNWENDADFNAIKLCVQMEPSAHKWQVTECTSTAAYMCQKLDVIGNCPNHWQRSHSNDVCYGKIGSGDNDSSEEECDDINGVTAETIMPKDEEETLALQSYMTSANITATYIGLTLAPNRKDWHWDDSESLQYTNWMSEQPGNWKVVASYIQPCVSIQQSNDFQWNDTVYCEDNVPTICQCRLGIYNIPNDNSWTYCYALQGFDSMTTTVNSSTDKTTSTTNGEDMSTSNLYTTLSTNQEMLNTTSTSKVPTQSTAIQETTQSITDIGTIESTSYFQTTVYQNGKDTTSSYKDNLSSCSLICLCENYTISDDRLNVRLASIRINLTLNKSTLSSSTRKLISADDTRKSSRVIGGTGAIIIVIVIGFVVFLDVVNTNKLYNNYILPQ